MGLYTRILGAAQGPVGAIPPQAPATLLAPRRLAHTFPGTGDYAARKASPLVPIRRYRDAHHRHHRAPPAKHCCPATARRCHP